MSLETSSSNWLLKINEGKSMYTLFSLSTQKRPVKLLLNGKALREDENATYLCITLDH